MCTKRLDDLLGETKIHWFVHGFSLLTRAFFCCKPIPAVPMESPEIHGKLILRPWSQVYFGGTDNSCGTSHCRCILATMVFGTMMFMHCLFMKQTNEVFIIYGKIMPWLHYTTSVLMFSCYTNWCIYLHVFDVYGKLVGKYTISFVNIDAMGLVLLNFPNFSFCLYHQGRRQRSQHQLRRQGGPYQQPAEVVGGLSTIYDDGWLKKTSKRWLLCEWDFWLPSTVCFLGDWSWIGVLKKSRYPQWQLYIHITYHIWVFPKIGYPKMDGL